MGHKLYGGSWCIDDVSVAAAFGDSATRHSLVVVSVLDVTPS